jgi:hypothetical protein
VLVQKQYQNIKKATNRPEKFQKKTTQTHYLSPSPHDCITLFNDCKNFIVFFQKNFWTSGQKETKDTITPIVQKVKEIKNVKKRKLQSATQCIKMRHLPRNSHIR